MLTKLRKSYLFNRFRRSAIFVWFIRPIHDFRQTRQWWKKGKPTPPPHAIKMSTLLYWADRTGANNFIETGSYLGDTIRHMQGRFEKIVSIEIAPIFVESLKVEFQHDPLIEIILGDSGAELPAIVEKLTGPAVFWLDAHHSGGDTQGFNYVPIFAEIETIHSKCRFGHAIVIDDMTDFIGKDGYPTVPALYSFLQERGYETVNFNNMMQAWRGLS